MRKKYNTAVPFFLLCVIRAVVISTKNEKMKKLTAFVILFQIAILNLYAINPMRDYKMKPDKFDIEYEEKKILSTDGAMLNTWIMKSTVENKKNYTFIIVGSDAGNMGFSLAYALYLLNNGYDVITFDYRGFGESSDFEYKADNLYHTEYIEDFHSVVSWVKKEIAPEKIGILAFSMGTLIATSEFEKSKYDLLVAEAFIKSPKKIVQRIKKTKGKKINLPKSTKSHRANLNKINIPILLFCSTEDKITTLKDSRKVASKMPNRKLIKFDGEHLRGAYTLGMDNYINEINQLTN